MQPPLGIVPPLAYVTVLPPDTAVFVPVHVPPTFGVDATTRFEGSASTNALVSVALVPFVFPRLIVRVLVPLGAIDVGLKDFDTVGKFWTDRFAVVGDALVP